MRSLRAIHRAVIKNKITNVLPLNGIDNGTKYVIIRIEKGTAKAVALFKCLKETPSTLQVRAVFLFYARKRLCLFAVKNFIAKRDNCN